MSIAEAVLEKFEALPPDKQREVLDFATILGQRLPQHQTRHSAKGLLAGLTPDAPTEQDITEVRKEIWGMLTLNRA